MSMDAIRWARAMRGITPTQRHVLLLLADHADEAGHAHPSAARLAEDSGFTDRAVRSALLVLEERGLIEATARNVGTATHWCLDLRRTEPRNVVPAPATPPRNVVPPTPERGSGNPGTSRRKPRNVVPTEPSRTPIEPPGNPQRGKQPGLPLPLPTWVPAEAWNAFVRFRRERGKSLTQHGADLLIRNLRKLADAGDDPAAVLEQSIANGWTGVFPTRSRGPPSRASPSDTIREVLAELEPHE